MLIVRMYCEGKEIEPEGSVLPETASYLFFGCPMNMENDIGQRTAQAFFGRLRESADHMADLDVLFDFPCALRGEVD